MQLIQVVHFGYYFNIISCWKWNPDYNDSPTLLICEIKALWYLPSY